MEIKILKEKSDLVKSEEYKKIRKYQLDMITEVSTSDIDEKEIKGMLKLIKKTDVWTSEYEKQLKNNK